MFFFFFLTQIPMEEKRSWYFKMATIYIRYATDVNGPVCKL